MEIKTVFRSVLQILFFIGFADLYRPPQKIKNAAQFYNFDRSLSSVNRKI